MANNKFTKLAALVLLGAFGLTACDNDVFAKPKNYDDGKIITVTEDGKDVEIYNNIISTVYDGIRDGALASDVLDNVLYEYAVSMFGRYNAVSGKDAMEDGEVTLKVAANAAKHSDVAANKAIVDAFVKAHKAYWTVNADGKRINDNGVEVEDNAEASAREIARVSKKWDSIEERIAEAMYDKISGGSYSTKNIFRELKLLQSLKFDMKKVADYKEVTTAFEGLLTPDVEPKDVWGNFLTRDFYQPNAAVDADEKENKITYIEDEIIPTIYRSLLTEQFLVDTTYNAVARAAARKVNAITVANNDNYDKAAPYLMGRLVAEINKEGSDVNLNTFKKYANVLKGVGLDAEEKAIADKLVELGAFEQGTTKDGESYYKGTKHGDMMENYDKIDDNPLLTDASVESDFTGSNKYTKEEGKELKEREIALVDYVTTGWYAESTGVEGLPSDITKRLFNAGVATALDRGTYNKDTKAWEAEETDRWQNGTYDASRDVNEFVAKINGKYYLKNKGAEQGDDNNDILFYDRDSKTYYVVQIEEATNFNKLSREGNKNYQHIHNDETMEEYVNQVLKIVGAGESYSTLSKKHWLEEMNLKYHDTVVYDYFKANFPELFD